MDNFIKRVVITGMAINTPIGDTLDTFYDNLIAGKSAISKWKFFDSGPVLSKLGGDLSEYDVKGKLASLREQMPPELHKRMRKLVKKGPFSTRITILCAADAFLDARLEGAVAPDEIGVVLGGHNLHNNLFFRNVEVFQDEPEYIDSMLSLHSLDTDVASSVGEALNIQGPAYSMGGACASANVALRSAVDEIRYHDNKIMLVAGAPLDFSPLDLQAMAIMGAISYKSFHDEPRRASRPYDTAREGFVPSHGAAILVVEDLEHAQQRGAKIYGEVMEVATASDACHLPSPSVDGQTRTMTKLLNKAGVAREEIDYVSAHATSTPLGDITEITSLKKVFGDHAYKLKVNATKSMLGHTCWAAPVVETVAAVLQMQRGKLHPSINIENLDPEVDLDICANEAVEHPIRYIVKNSFGFGGINCCSLLRNINAL